MIEDMIEEKQGEWKRFPCSSWLYDFVEMNDAISSYIGLVEG